MKKSGHEKIIEATEKLVFAGKTKMSTRQIAKEAGVSPSLIFHFYAKKDDLLLDAAKRSVKRFLSALDQVKNLDLPADQKLKKFMVLHAEMVEEGRFFINFLFQKVFSQDTNFIETSKSVHIKSHEIIKSIVEEGVKNKIFPDKKVENIVEVVIRYLHSITFSRVMNLRCDENIDLPQSFDFLISLIKK